jgi:hypothetical protein
MAPSPAVFSPTANTRCCTSPEAYRKGETGFASSGQKSKPPLD